MQYGKVDICGLDTSTLTVLKEEEKITLLKKAKDGDEGARDELISGNLRLVLSVVQRFLNRGEVPDDLFQVGCIGLIKSIDNFDISQQVKFSTYAVPMIIGEIRRFLRDGSALRVSRSIKDTAYHVMQAKEKLTARLDREPTVLEIAAELDLPKEDIVMAIESVTVPISIYEPVYSDSGDNIYLLDQLSCGDNEVSWVDEISMRETIDGLSPREKTIVKLRFLEGKTQTEVSKIIGISQAQVSRLEKGVIDKIKA
ncbi:MAG: RNA polymerase sporulation sigma factor SigG [Oscillospiraceae bacterium]|nr:RNA polymerase sporulation sigma factor SigG [Candidatus Equicaccousia limihippi]